MKFKKFIQKKVKKIKENNENNNQYKTIWVFPEIWTNRRIELLRNKISWKVISNLRTS